MRPATGRHAGRSNGQGIDAGAFERETAPRASEGSGSRAGNAAFDHHAGAGCRLALQRPTGRAGGCFEIDVAAYAEPGRVKGGGASATERDGTARPPAGNSPESGQQPPTART